MKLNSNLKTQSESELPEAIQDPNAKERYYVLSFPDFDCPVVVIIDRDCLSEARKKYPNGSFWSIEALEKYIALPKNRDPVMWKAVNLVKSIFKGRVVG